MYRHMYRTEKAAHVNRAMSSMFRRVHEQVHVPVPVHEHGSRPDAFVHHMQREVGGQGYNV